MLGLSFRSAQRLQPKTEHQAALRRVRLKYAHLNGLNVRFGPAPGVCRPAEQNREERRVEQGTKEFDFDR
jgi:hypothetical protein